MSIPAGLFSPVLLWHRVRIHPECAHVVGVRRRLLVLLLRRRLRLRVALLGKVLAGRALPLVIAAPAVGNYLELEIFY